MFWFSFIKHRVGNVVYNSGRVVVESDSSERARTKMLQDLWKWTGYELCGIVYGPYDSAEEAQSTNPYTGVFNKEALSDERMSAEDA